MYSIMYIFVQPSIRLTIGWREREKDRECSKNVLQKRKLITNEIDNKKNMLQSKAIP